MKNSSFVCPVCGALLQAGAKVCRDCGSDDKTGWSEETYMDGIDLPYGDDEYEAIRAKEFGNAKAGGIGANGTGQGGIRIDWKMIVGTVVLTAFLLTFVCR